MYTYACYIPCSQQYMVLGHDSSLITSSNMSFNPYPWITGRRETKSPDLPPEAKQLYNSVKGDIMSVDQVPGNVFYKNVQPDTTALVLEAIDEDPDIQGESARINYNSRSLDFVVTFPTFFHGVQSAWLMSVFRKARSNRYFSQAEWDRLHISHYRSQSPSFSEFYFLPAK